MASSIFPKRTELCSKGKIWWFLTFVVSIITCLFIIYGTYQQWSENSVVVTISNKLTPIYDIKFPAVTICPISKMPNYHRLPRINSTIPCNEPTMASYLCQRSNIGFGTGNCSPNDSTPLEVSGEELLRFMSQVKPEFQPVSCNFFTKVCVEPLQTVTEEGICYTYNMMDSRQIFKNTVQNYIHLNKNKSGISKILVQYLPGRNRGMVLTLVDSDLQHDFCAEKHGYKVFLHNSYSIPGFNSFYLNLNQTKTVKLYPRIVVASETIKKYNFNKRKCYFAHERKLKFFKIYTKMNCELECWANYTKHICGCAYFSMPKEEKTPICINWWEHRCASILTKEMVTMDKMISQNEENHPELQAYFDDQANIFKYQSTRNATVDILNCKCLPTCSELDYKAEFSEQTLDFYTWQTTNMINFYGNKKISHVSHLEIFFDESEFVAYERKELYGPLDFLADFGGLLGLFCGFSLLSFVELLYFLSVRIICNKVLYGTWIEEKN